MTGWFILWLIKNAIVLLMDSTDNAYIYSCSNNFNRTNVDGFHDFDFEVTFTIEKIKVIIQQNALIQ